LRKEKGETDGAPHTKRGPKFRSGKRGELRESGGGGAKAQGLFWNWVVCGARENKMSNQKKRKKKKEKKMKRGEKKKKKKEREIKKIEKKKPWKRG